MTILIPNFPFGTLLAGPRNKYFTSFYMLYSNFLPATASVTTTMVFVVWTLEFLLPFLSYLRILL